MKMSTGLKKIKKLKRKGEKETRRKEDEVST
jgi:hypothetical protein